MAVSIQKVVILLTQSTDWDDWYEVIRATAVRKGVFNLIDVTKETAPTALSKPVKPTLTSAKAGATSSGELSASEQSYYKILLDEHKDNLLYSQPRLTTRYPPSAQKAFGAHPLCPKS